jgi:hypothetical protein
MRELKAKKVGTPIMVVPTLEHPMLYGYVLYDNGQASLCKMFNEHTKNSYTTAIENAHLVYLPRTSAEFLAIPKKYQH